ncbi:class I lanthipeptide [Chitinophaga agrisoli]|uniref:class I lanthipeptide n=1 Tax=Chitinophaga agrisoli TaxID=2607653 RepID=UPI001661CEB3|nr:class I lanthipeptide [Chitinophaga agrisoli]
MKKRMEKKLTLGKLKIAKLSHESQAALQGGAARPTYTGCSFYKCPPPPAGQQ